MTSCTMGFGESRFCHLGAFEVFNQRDHFKMFRVDAAAMLAMIATNARQWIMAGMVNLQSGRYFFSVDQQRSAMREDTFTLIHKRPIAVFIGAADPFPASSFWIYANVPKKTLKRITLWSTIGISQCDSLQIALVRAAERLVRSSARVSILPLEAS